MREGPLTHPFVCDDLIGSILRRIQRRQTVADFAIAGVCCFALQTRSRCRAARVTGRGDVIQVQVLLISLVLLLQGFIEDVGVIPDLNTLRGQRLKLAVNIRMEVAKKNKNPTI